MTMAYNILIVDDSAIVRKSLMKTFGMTSIEVGNFYQAANGKEGLEWLDKQWVDLVILDINMPIMNGMDFMKHVHNEGKHLDVPVVVVSTEGSQERISELSSLGVKAYLRKPVSPEDLAHTFTKILGD
jgi:two-component system chemotaxis response regulator CheY